MSPDSTTILLIGRQGQVGWELQRTLAPLGRLVSVDYPEIDLADPASLDRWVRDTQPHIIVNAAAYTAVDKAESEPERAETINGAAPGHLARAAQARGALFIHYSTDYVYDGAKTTPYVETDPAQPLSAYGRSKWAGDQAVIAADGNYLIFRLCWVYGARGANFLRTIMRLARERETLRIVHDQIGSPTWSRMIAETTALALHRWQSSPDPRALRGVYHLSAAGSTSWHGFTEAIVRQLPADSIKCRRVDAITTPEYPLPARRPAYSVMDNRKLAQTFGLRLPSWEEQLRLVFASLDSPA